VSVLGEVRCERAYYYCPHRKRGHCPWEAALRVDATDLTPGAQEAVSLAGLLASFAEARQKVLPKLAGLRLSEATVQRSTEQAGSRLGRHLAGGGLLGAGRPWDWHTDAKGRTCAYLSADATGVGQQGPGGARAEGRMAWVGMVFNPRPAAGAGPAQARVLAGLYELPALGLQLRKQAAQVGMEAAEVWVGLTDGGNGLEGMIRSNFNRPDLVLILDFYHAAEHLHGLARAWLGEGEAARARAGEWCHALKHRGGAALLRQLEGLDRRGKSAAAREAHRLALGYVRANVHRMDYPHYLANGWLIGSGHIEAACKAVVGARLKGSGMRWGEEGSDAVCHLRALFKSEADQWETFWAMAL
jgi:hypothetical protein